MEKLEKVTPAPFLLGWLRRFLFKDPLVAVLVVFIAATILFVGLWVFAVARIRRDARLLQLQFEAHLKDRAVVDASIRAELDTIYRTLYAPPDLSSSTLPRQPSQVELWQRNRDKELRDRILRLEQWRLREERR